MSERLVSISSDNYFNGCFSTFASAKQLPGGGSEVTVPLANGCLNNVGANEAGFFGFDSSSLDDYTAFSFEFDFSGGLTSRAAFNSSGVADSTMPFYLSRSDVPPDSVGLYIPTDPTLFNAISEISFSGGEPINVPEPSVLAILALALALAIPLARRQVR